MFLELIKNLFGGSNKSELQKYFSSETILLDVRSSDEFRSGSVNGAVNIPLGELVKNSMKLKKEKPIIVFCRSGNRSAMAIDTLKQLGFKSIVNGGSWQNVQSIVHNLKHQQII